jgi:two-component system aerobic respiration control sensor histidine kinase ArcB
LLDITIGIHYLGSEDLVLELLKGLKADSITDDLALIKIAHDQGDWSRVEELAHKMKSGATFGTVRLYYAFLYMERYRKAGHSACLEPLYQQMLRVIDETMACLNELFK